MRTTDKIDFLFAFIQMNLCDIECGHKKCQLIWNTLLDLHSLIRPAHKEIDKDE